MHLKIVAHRLSGHCKVGGVLPEEQYGFRPARSTVDMLFVMRPPQDFGRPQKIPLYMYFLDLQKAYNSVDRELLWKVLARIGVPQTMIAVVRQFHDGMRALACGRTMANTWSGSEVKQGLRQGYLCM